MTHLFHHPKLLWAVLAIGILASPGCTGKGERKDEVTASRASAMAASAPARVAASREVEEIIDGWRARNDNAPLIEHRFYYDDAGSYRSFVELPSRDDATIIVTSTEQAYFVSGTPLHVDQLHGVMVFAAIPPETFEAIRSYTLGRVDYQLRDEISGKPPSGIVAMQGFALEDVKGNMTSNILNHVPIHGVGLTDLKEGTLALAIEQSFVSGINSTKVTSIGNLMQNATAAIYAGPDAGQLFENDMQRRNAAATSSGLSWWLPLGNAVPLVSAPVSTSGTEPVSTSSTEFLAGSPPSPGQVIVTGLLILGAVADVMTVTGTGPEDISQAAGDAFDFLVDVAKDVMHPEGVNEEFHVDLYNDTAVKNVKDENGNVVRTTYYERKDSEWVETSDIVFEIEDTGEWEYEPDENGDPDTPPPNDDTDTMPSDPDAEPCDPSHYACALGGQLGSYTGPGEVKPSVEGHLDPLILPPGPDDPGGGDGSQAGTAIKEDPGSLILPPGPDDPGVGDGSQAGTPIKEDPGSLILPPHPDDPGAGDGSQAGTPIKGDPGASIPPPVPGDPVGGSRPSPTPGTIETTVGSRLRGTGFEAEPLPLPTVLQETLEQHENPFEDLSTRELEQLEQWQQSGGGSGDESGSTSPKPDTTPREGQDKPGEAPGVYEPKIPTWTAPIPSDLLSKARARRLRVGGTVGITTPWSCRRETVAWNGEIYACCPGDRDPRTGEPTRMCARLPLKLPSG